MARKKAGAMPSVPKDNKVPKGTEVPVVPVVPEVTEAPAVPRAKPLENFTPARREPKPYVAKGRSITSRRGIRPPGTLLKHTDFSVDPKLAAEILDRLVAKGYVELR